MLPVDGKVSGDFVLVASTTGNDPFVDYPAMASRKHLLVVHSFDESTLPYLAKASKLMFLNRPMADRYKELTGNRSWVAVPHYPIPDVGFTAIPGRAGTYCGGRYRPGKVLASAEALGNEFRSTFKSGVYFNFHGGDDAMRRAEIEKAYHMLLDLKIPSHSMAFSDVPLSRGIWRLELMARETYVSVSDSPMKESGVLAMAIAGGLNILQRSGDWVPPIIASPSRSFGMKEFGAKLISVVGGIR
jgi:hypothetical protein